MACLGAKNITVWFQEGERREQGLHTPWDVLRVWQDLGFLAHALLSWDFREICWSPQPGLPGSAQPWAWWSLETNYIVSYLISIFLFNLFHAFPPFCLRFLIKFLLSALPMCCIQWCLHFWDGFSSYFTSYAWSDPFISLSVLLAFLDESVFMNFVCPLANAGCTLPILFPICLPGFIFSM